LTRILAIDTSSAWCSVALSIDDAPSLVRHQKVSAGASQFLLPWIDELLIEANTKLASLDAIAIGVGPGAFTGVRLGVAAVQGLAIAAGLPVIPVASLDAIAAQLLLKPAFLQVAPSTFLIAVDARMGEAYWAKYRVLRDRSAAWAERIGEIQLSAPEAVDLDGVDYVAGSAIGEFGDRLLASQSTSLQRQALLDSHLDAQIGIESLGVLICAQKLWAQGLQQDVRLLEPLYVRNKVAYTAAERALQ
jgi:tRNA threonylcarbamoyladenosine biosynthesis protein TsaB